MSMARHHVARGLARSLGMTVALALPLAAAADLQHAPGSKSRVQVAAQKANGSGVRVEYRVEGAGQPGQPAAVVLSFDGVTSASGATVHLAADGGATLLTAAALPDLRPHERVTVTVSVMPGGDGGYLHVFTSQDGLNSVASIPLQTGAGSSKLPPSDNLKALPNGDKILTMPVK